MDPQTNQPATHLSAVDLQEWCQAEVLVRRVPQLQKRTAPIILLPEPAPLPDTTV